MRDNSTTSSSDVTHWMPIPKLSPSKQHGFNPSIPESSPSFEDISRQLIINAEFIMKMISDHADKEIERIKNSIS